MRFGIPREVESRAYHVAISPAGGTIRSRAGHAVLVQPGAGEGSSTPGEDVTAAGARILAPADDVRARADLRLTVPEPAAEEDGRLPAGRTPLVHLRAERP